MSYRILRFPCFALFLAAAVVARAFEPSDRSDTVTVADSTAFGAAGTPVENATGEDSRSGSSFAAAPLDSSAPQLSVAYRDGQLILEWSPGTGDWVLEQSSSFDPAAFWVSVPISRAQTNGANISLAVSPCVQSMFYRLSQSPGHSLPLPGLAGSWSFDESTLPLAPDCTVYDSGISLSNVVRLGGRIGPGALWFNGGSADVAGSRALIGNSNLLSATGAPFSVCFWFNADDLASGWRGLIGNNADGLGGWNIALHSTGPGTNQLVFKSSGAGGLDLVARKLLLPGQWYELCATFDGSEGAIYLDSILLARGPGSVAARPGPLYLGGGLSGYDSFLGRIDELRIFTNALTHEEISLSGYWRMDETNSTLVADSSIRGHHGVLSSLGSRVAGKQGSAIDLSNATVALANSFSDLLPPTGGAFSLSFWVYPKTVSSEWNGLMNCDSFVARGWRLALGPDGAGKARLRFWSTDSGGTLDLSVPLDLPVLAWSKIDITFNGGIATVYLNGRRIASDNGGIQGSTAPLILGSVSGMNNFNGVIDELKIYRRERDETEIGPVAKVMWETVLLNTSSNLNLQGFGPPGRTLTYALANSVAPTNGDVTLLPGSAIVTYTAGANKGPDAFAYTVSDGEFTSPPTTVVISVVEPHWLSPDGGTTPPLDGSSPLHAWTAGPSDALDAIWHTNTYYDCFFYAPGQYETRGWKYVERQTANPGCKHIGSGRDGEHRTTVRLVNTWNSQGEGLIYGSINGTVTDGFEVQGMLLDCNAANNPKYAVGEPVSVTIPLATPGHVETVTLHWNEGRFPSHGKMPDGRDWFQFGRADEFTVCTRSPSANGWVTNEIPIMSMENDLDIPIDAFTDQIVLTMTGRPSNIDFYSLSEVEVTGASVSLPSATTPSGGQSYLNPNNAEYSINHVVDGDEGTVWASGRDEEVDLLIPFEAGTSLSQVSFSWNCHTVTGLGRLGPATDFVIQTRDSSDNWTDIPFVTRPRTSEGRQTATFSHAVTTAQLRIRLKTRELGVDFYSLKEIRFENASTPISPRLPSAFNTFVTFNILRAFDGDQFTQWTSDSQGMIGALLVMGNNLKFTDLNVIGFGTKANCECFAMTVYPPPVYIPGPSAFGNVLIEDCSFTQPAQENTDGLTTVTMMGLPARPLTNAIVRRCSVAGVRPWFSYSGAFTAINVENCVVEDCATAVYFEPARSWGDNVGKVLVRSNAFLNVDWGISMLFHSGAQFDALDMIANDIVLNGAGGAAFGVCDLCELPGGSITNVTALGNVVRYSDWSYREFNRDIGFLESDIRNAAFGNNVISLPDPLRVRQCPAGYSPPPPEIETCDSAPTIPSTSPGTYSLCLDSLPVGYRRALFNNYNLIGERLNVKHIQSGVDGLAAQQQWP